jgi:hypothetical protein
MSRTGLFLPFGAIADGVRYWREHGARIRRARVWRQYGDAIFVQRLRDYQVRSERLYRRVLASLRACPGFEDDRAGALSEQARRALGRAERPLRKLEAGVAVIAGALALLVLVVVLLACAMSPSVRSRFFPADLAAGRPWVASNADPGYAPSGFGPSGTGPAFFHTTSMERPSIEIDLGDEHVVRSVLIENRADCCRERALPLDVEVFDGRSWRLVAERRSPFTTWRYDIDPVRTRKVRLVRAGVGFFHLKRISVYGQ